MAEKCSKLPEDCKDAFDALGMMDKVKAAAKTASNIKVACKLPGKIGDCLSGIKDETSDLVGGFKDVAE